MHEEKIAALYGFDKPHAMPVARALENEGYNVCFYPSEQMEALQYLLNNRKIALLVTVPATDPHYVNDGVMLAVEACDKHHVPAVLHAYTQPGFAVGVQDFAALEADIREFNALGEAAKGVSSIPFLPLALYTQDGEFNAQQFMEVVHGAVKAAEQTPSQDPIISTLGKAHKTDIRSAL